MARLNNRRSRAADSEEEDDNQRASTPLSSAPQDRKRIRQNDSPSSDIASDDARDTSRSRTIMNTNVFKMKSKVLGKPSSKRKHQPGAIVRVKLTNFVTYTSAEFFPGPNLNMVIGPNGTGKSTLVCAICLGLGYPPSVLGRAKDPAEFVKHGCKESTIEIELQRATKGSIKTATNPIIVRTIKRETNKSDFWINGNRANNKAVQGLCAEFKIKCDNLCQFLPQDRVVEFAQMTPVQLLSATLDAAAEPAALEYHEHLKQIREHQQHSMAHNKGDQENLENLEKRQASQQVEVGRLRERKEILQKMEWLESCRPIPKYQTMKARANEVRRRKAELQVETERLKDECAPALRKVNAKQQYAESAKQNRDQRKSEVKRVEDQCKKIEKDIEKLVEKQKECDDMIIAEQNRAKKDKEDFGRQRRNIATLRQQKESEPESYDTRAVNDQIQEYKNQSRELSQKMVELNTKFESLKRQGLEKTNRLKELRNRFNDLGTQEGQRDMRLEKISPHTHQAWQWIKDNQQRFKKEILGPPAVTCSVKDPRMAAALENLLQPNDFKILTVQCTEDFKLLQEELNRKQRLHDIVIRTCSAGSVNGFSPPVEDSQLRELGLEQWALDCLEGPEIVLAMLCGERFLHQCGIAVNDVTQEQHDAISNSALKSYIAGNKSVRFTRRAEYGAAGVTAQIRDIRPARVWTDQPVDTGVRHQIEQEMRSLKMDADQIRSEYDATKTQYNEMQTEKQEIDEAKEKLTKEKEDYQKRLTDWRGLDTKISHAEEKMKQCQDNIDGVRTRCSAIVRDRDEAMFKQADVVLQYAGAANLLKEQHAKLLEAEVLLIEAVNDSDNLKRMNQEIKDLLTKKERELEQAAKDDKETHDQARALMNEVRTVKRKAEELEEETGESGLLDLMEQLSRDGGVSEQELEAMLDSEQARLELTGGGADAANTIREFEERGKKIEKLRTKLADFTKQQEDYMAAINEVRGKFEAALNPIVDKIDAAFAESFRRIKCAGTVTVYRASSEDPADCTEAMGGVENGLDFADWAIHIYVTFRNSEPLQLLDSHRQSGGERAVSTIFYLMALQSLSRSPFRLVDEINQGMDPINERMVHGRMVDLAIAAERARDEGRDDVGGSQYFLITPKLLNGLRYERGMTVLCIVSGENMPNAADTRTRNEQGIITVEKGRAIDFAAFARKARELRTELEGSHKTDSSVSLVNGGRSVRVGA